MRCLRNILKWQGRSQIQKCYEELALDHYIPSCGLGVSGGLDTLRAWITPEFPYISFTGLCRDACEPVCFKPICFKPGVTSDSIKLYSMVPVRITLTFAQGHMATRRLELVQSFCCKAARRNRNIRDGYFT